MKKDEMINTAGNPKSDHWYPSYDELGPMSSELINRNQSLDDKLTKMRFPGSTYEPIISFEPMF